MNRDELLGLFRSHLTIDLNLSRNTIESYDSDMADYLKWCGSARVDTLHVPTEKIYDYLLKLRNKGLNPATIARRLSTLKHFYKFAVGEGLTDKNPCASIEGPRLMRKLPKILDENEIVELLLKPDKSTPAGLRDHAILELWYACGLRISEVQRIQISDLMLELQLLRVMGKGGKERLVPFGRYAHEALSLYMQSGRPSFVKERTGSELFLNRLGGGFSRMGLWKMLRKYANQCNFKFTVRPHTVRHSCATHMIEAGADIRTVMEFLGHADISTTQIYTHLDREYLQEVHKSFHPRA
jgi:integrase/recombinase XerD